MTVLLCVRGVFIARGHDTAAKEITNSLLKMSRRSDYEIDRHFILTKPD